MALAGYEIDDAPNFWRRMAIEHPTGIDYGGLHPTTPERFLGLERGIAEIKQNLADGVDLIAEVNIPDLGAFSEDGNARLPIPVRRNVRADRSKPGRMRKSRRKPKTPTRRSATEKPIRRATV